MRTCVCVCASSCSSGLTLLLNVEEDEYTAMTDTTGLKVVIHHQNDMPFPFDEGIIVSPGFTTEIAISRVRNHVFSPSSVATSNLPPQAILEMTHFSVLVCHY